MSRFFIAASAIGAVASATGLVTGFFFDWPAGPTTVAVLAVAYAVLWLFKWGAAGLIRLIR